MRLTRFVVLAAGCAAGQPASGNVPPPAATIADRVGVYSWGFDDTSWPKAPDRLTWSADQVAGLGAHVIRVVLSPADPYQVGSGATTLRELAARPAYAALWGDPRWSTIVITAYSQADLGNPWSSGYARSDAAAERAEIADLGSFLLGFPDKRFVILPWEGDNALAPFPADAAWDGYVDWIAARADGVTDARLATASTSELYSGLELDAVCAAGERCVASHVAPRVSVDYVSYSAWPSLAAEDPAAQLTADLASIEALIDRPARNLIVGELGAARDAPHATECSAATRAIAALQAADRAGVSYTVAWQIIDNAPAGDALVGFGARKYDGTESMLGVGLANVAMSHTPVLPITECAEIGDGGVVNGTTFDHQIHAGDTVSIFGTGFTPAGNVVHFTQGATHTTATAGSPYWFESATQINVTLPTGIGAGAVHVHVSGAGQLDSNREPIVVQ